MLSDEEATAIDLYISDQNLAIFDFSMNGQIVPLT
jgi:hypothetical protein